MQPKDWALVKRVVIDLVSLIPYTVIMVIPLSPPGHVFAFSLWKKCFPAAVPSMFTAQRQDVYEIYSRIAYEAKASAGDATVGSSSTDASLGAASPVASATSSASVALRKAKVWGSVAAEALAAAWRRKSKRESA